MIRGASAPLKRKTCVKIYRRLVKFFIKLLDFLLKLCFHKPMEDKDFKEFTERFFQRLKFPYIGTPNTDRSKPLPEPELPQSGFSITIITRKSPSDNLN